MACGGHGFAVPGMGDALLGLEWPCMALHGLGKLPEVELINGSPPGRLINYRPF